MKLASSFVALTLATQFAVAKDRYLVTFKSEQGFQAMDSYFKTEAAQNFGQVQKSLKYVNAVVLKSQNKMALENLKNHPEVLDVEEEVFKPAPKPANGFKLARFSPLEMRGRKSIQTPNQVVEDIPVLRPGAETPWGILAVKAGEAWEQSQAGANARVLVLDTGIDKNHPAIVNNFSMGQNFSEDNKGKVDPTNFIDEEGHGTHVSGTILGAYNEKNGFTGVAPKAKLLMGRVCSANGCSNIAVVEGINWGISQKVDVINMSLGGPIGSSGEAKAVKDAEKAGVVVVAASGNSATEPTYSHDKKDPKCRSTNPYQPVMCGVGFPAAFPTVIAVGAVDVNLKKTNFSQWGPELDVTAPGADVVSSVPQGTGRSSTVIVTVNQVEKAIKSAAFSGTQLFSQPLVNEIVVVPGVGKDTDFAKVNVAGKIALISRGEIKFSDKIQNALAKKAIGVLIYNNQAGLMQGAATADGSLLNIPVVMIEQTEGLALIEALKVSDATVKASVQLAASDFASFDGTSMASPHVAGVVALIKSANKNLTPAQVREILSKTSMALTPNDTNQFGAGIVQADKAVAAALAK